MKSRSWSEALRSFADPMTYFQAVRILHYYSYSHVRPRRRVTLGEGATIAPNASLRNGERIVIGRGSKIGERAYIWAGDASGRITIGEDCRFGPEVFVTASDYGLSPDANRWIVLPFLLAGVLLVGLGAADTPALRALRVQPSEALRGE